MAISGSGALGTNSGGPGQILKGEITPSIEIRVALLSGSTEFSVEVYRFEGADYFSASTKIRIYWVPASQVSPREMNSQYWFRSANINKKFVTELSFATVSYIQFNIPAAPYAAGGWFFAVQVLATGIETFGSDPVLAGKIDPTIVVPNLPTQQVLNVTVAQVNINGIIQLTFRWQLPNVAATPQNPLGPLLDGHVQIWIYNYENRGDWRQFGPFDVRARSFEYETGVVLYRPDFDGLHNVEVHFVASNAAMMYQEPSFLAIPAPFVTLVGGIGP